MNPGCPICLGTGRRPCEACGGLRLQAVPEMANQFSPEGCRRCATTTRTQSRLGAGVPRGATAWTFDRMTKQYPALTNAAAELQALLDRGKGWAIASEDPGRGKSYLFAAMANEALKRGMSVRYYEEMEKFLQDLQDAQTGNSPYTYNGLMQTVSGVDVLVLDEFGEQKDSEFRLIATRSLLVSRSDTGGWPITLLATNRTPEELTRRFPWLASRFMHPAVIELDLTTVPDLREELSHDL